MTIEAERSLSDDDLDRMARQLFAEVRAEHPEAKADRALQSAGELAGEIVPGLPDWLQEAHEGEAAGNPGSD